MQLIVTRPVAQALRWVEQLRALGLEAQALPLIDIAPASDVAPVVAAWQRLPDWRFIMFVSANAVLHFFALRPRDAHWRASLRAGATGPGTRAALIDAGVPAAQIVAPDDGAAELDSEALWRRLAHDDCKANTCWWCAVKTGATGWQSVGAALARRCTSWPRIGAARRGWTTVRSACSPQRNVSRRSTCGSSAAARRWRTCVSLRRRPTGRTRGRWRRTRASRRQHSMPASPRCR